MVIVGGVAGGASAAAHGWDVAGATWAGMRTAFVARPGQQMFPLGPAIDVTVPTLAGLPGELERM